jgi:hypothetical protein
MGIFKKSPVERRAALAAQLAAAEAALDKARAAAVQAAVDGAADATQATAEAKIHAAEIHVEVLRNALAELDRQSAAAETAALHAKDRALREETSRRLHKLADQLEKTVAPLPDVLLDLKSSVDSCGSILGPPGGLPTLLENMSKEIPTAIALFVGELRARAEATLAGSAPAGLPAPPILEVVRPEPEPPTIQLFTLQSLTWLDERGQRQRCGPFQILSLPVEVAKRALDRQPPLALDPESERARNMRASNKNLPHVADPTKTYDLDEDPNLPRVVTRQGIRPLAPEPTFQPYDRGPPKQVFIQRPEPKPAGPDEEF